MQVISGAALMLLQDDMGQLTHDVHLTMIYVGILAISVLVLVLVLLIAGVVMAALAARAIKSAEQLEKRASPIMDKANELMAEFTPKLRTLTDNVEHISTVARGKVDEVGETVTQINQTVQQANKTAQEANARARAQVARADGIVSDALTATQQISDSVQHSIRVPVRQVAGIVAGVKAGLETWIARSPFASATGERARSGGVRYESRPKQESYGQESYKQESADPKTYKQEIADPKSYDPESLG